MPATITLAGTALALALLIAFPVGIYAACATTTLLDQGAMLFALIGQSVPVFCIGIMLILLFSVELRWLPTGGSGTVQHLILPSIALGLYSAARTARLVRSACSRSLPRTTCGRPAPRGWAGARWCWATHSATRSSRW